MKSISMTLRIVVIIVATLQIISFFIPWISVFFKYSAWDILFGKAANGIDFPVKYILVLPPLASFIIILGELMNSKLYLRIRDHLLQVPIFTIFGLLLFFIANRIFDPTSVKHMTFKGIANVIATGPWLALFCAFTMLVIRMVSSSLSVKFIASKKSEQS